MDTVHSVAGYIETVVKSCPNHKWIFRGQCNKSHPLRPKAGRPEYHPLSEGQNDLTRFKRWSEEAPAFESNLPENAFELLAVAQHFGLATRLLDWTLNAAAALYFATEDQKEDRDGGVFVFRRPETVDLDKEKLETLSNVKFYRPRFVSRRIVAQDGVFTIHPKPEKPLEATPFALNPETNEPATDLMVMHVPGNRKTDLQKDLRAIGVLTRSMYPDLEGLSKSINCQTNWLLKK